jgi:hypothetical protein
MRYIRIYTGPDDLSHIEDVDVELHQDPDAERSTLWGAQSLFMTRTPVDYDLDWHQAPRRQFVITLSGEWEVETSDGTVRRLGPGDILLAEDTTGKGHRTRTIGGKERTSVSVPLAG